MLTALVFSVYIPFVQHFIVSKLENSIGESLDADVKIGFFDLSYFADINLDHIQITKQNDTLLVLEKLKIDVAFRPLLHHQVVIKDLQLTGLNTQLDQLIGYNDTTKTTDKPETIPENSWGIQLNHVSISNSNLALYDAEMNMDIQIEVGKGSIGKLIIDSFAYNANDILLEDSRVSYVSPYSPDVDDDSSETDFIFTSNKIVFINSAFYYNDSLMTFTVGGKHLFADDLFVNVAREKVRITNVEMDQSYFNLLFINDTLEKPYVPLLWKVNIDRAKISNSKFIYDVPYRLEDPNHFDNNHIHFTEMSAEAQNIFYSEPQISLNLLSGSFNENNQVRIESSSGQLFMDTSKIALKHFQLETKEGIMKMHGALGYNVIESDFKDNGKLNMKMQYETKKSNNWSDLDYFVAEYISEIPNLEYVRNKYLNLSASVRGHYDSLYVALNMEYDHSAQFICEGNVDNGTQDQGFKYDLTIENLTLAKRNIALFIDDKQSLEYIPQHSNFKGKVDGTLSTTAISGIFASDYGKQNIDAKIDRSDSISKIVAQLDGNLNAGAIYNFSVDTITFDGQLEGEAIGDLLADVNMQMIGIHIDSLSYDSLIARLDLKNQHFEITIDSKDPHAKFQLVSKGKLNDSLIHSKTNLDISNFSFKESGIMVSPEVLALKSSIDFDYSFNSPSIDLNADFNHISLADTLEINRVKRLKLDYSYRLDKTTFNLYTDNNTIEAIVDGNLDTLINNFNSFIDILILDDTSNQAYSLYFPSISLHADIKDPYELLGKNIAQELPKITSLNIDAQYNSQNKEIDINVFMPDFYYTGNSFDSTALNISGDINGFKYTLGSRMYLDSLIHAKIRVDGDFKHRQLFSHINLKGRENDEFIDVSFLTKEEGDGYLISIPKDTILIISNKWNVKENNSLFIEPNHFVATNIALNRADKEIQITTNDAKKQISLLLKNIDLSVFNAILKNDTLLGGNARVNLAASFDEHVNYVNLEAQIDTFQYENYTIGDIRIDKATFNNDRFIFNSSLKGDNNTANIDGNIQFDEQKSLDINLDIAHLKLDFLNVYLDEYLYAVKGAINAKMKITGSLDAPIMNGFFQFNNTEFGLNDLQEVFKMSRQKVLFNNNTINPKHLTISDHNNHKSYFDGSIDISKKSLHFHDFHIKSEAMELMNSTKNNNQVIFGKIVANFDIKMNGPLDNLSTKSIVKFDYPTVVNYTFPEDLSVSKNEDIVNFTHIDTLSLIDSILTKEMLHKQSHLMDIFNFLEAELIVSEGCRFNLYFDNSMENYINVTIEGDVKYLFSDELPKTSGMLNIVKGQMNYSMPMVAMKEMNIEENSFIQITNEVKNPFISINATSKIWAQTGDLIEGYNKNLEVTVFVKMRGTLDNLVIQFDVSPQTNDALVTTKISQMSEKERTMNAVNLLIRGQFASKQNNVTIDVNSYVNSLIAKGLNKLISDRISFVDMSFDIKSFTNINSNGAVEEQSNMFFNVGKSFYHDRIRINYRGNLTSKMTKNEQQYGSTDSYTESNITMEYDITKSGNFQAVIFRKDTYEDIMEGDIVSTGGGIKIRKSYNTFGDIFKVGVKKKDKK